MPQMTDPMNALVSLQAELDEKRVYLKDCAIHQGLQMLVDKPNGSLRFTYAKVRTGVVEAIAQVALTEPINGIPCVQLGYAVIATMRGQRLASNTVAQALDEFQNGMREAGVTEFYVEAVVSQSNLASNKLAQRLLSASPVICTDDLSGEPALQYLKKVG